MEIVVRKVARNFSRKSVRPRQSLLDEVSKRMQIFEPSTSCYEKFLTWRTDENKDKWRWIDFLCEDSESTMNRDRKLFDEIKKGTQLPILRFYRWKNPTVSYGRTQGINPEEVLEYSVKNIEIVQRPTGGGKVFHKDDLCFSLIWTKENSTIPWSINESYCAIHRWMQRSLQELGIETSLSLRANSVALLPRNDKRAKNNGWCFQNPVRHDLVLNGKKIVGGAQWRDRNTVLHQGSIQIQFKENNLAEFAKTFCEMFSAKICLPNN